MEITNIQVIKLKGKGKLIGVANIVIENYILLKGIRIIDGERGRFIAMPSRLDNRSRKPKYREYFHPINQEARDILTNNILEAYDNLEK